ncbi:hypothetical protein MKX33_19090 [Paenibacillus sp. FSL R5-0490]
MLLGFHPAYTQVIFRVSNKCKIVGDQQKQA